VQASGTSAKGRSDADLLTWAQRALDRVTKRVDDQLEKISNVAYVLGHVAARHAATDALSPVVMQMKRSTPATRILEEVARRGATSLTMKWNVDGSASVRICNGPSFPLCAKPAALLKIISTPGGRPAGDGLIGWRSYAQVAAALTKLTGRATTRRNVTTTIHRLRTALRAENQNWFYIQTDHRGAIRFALRLSATDRSADLAHDLTAAQ
jgi:hypothetical protein